MTHEMGTRSCVEMFRSRCAFSMLRSKLSTEPMLKKRLSSPGPTKNLPSSGHAACEHIKTIRDGQRMDSLWDKERKSHDRGTIWTHTAMSLITAAHEREGGYIHTRARLVGHFDSLNLAFLEVLGPKLLPGDLSLVPVAAQEVDCTDDQTREYCSDAGPVLWVHQHFHKVLFPATLILWLFRAFGATSCRDAPEGGLGTARLFRTQLPSWPGKQNNNNGRMKRHATYHHPQNLMALLRRHPSSNS